MREDASILHVDADAFFASVEQRQKPSLRGRPVIVGGTGGRGVVATASYEARVFGVHSAQAGSVARRACPHGVFLAPRFAAYAEHSAVIMDVLREVSPLVEPLSLDEAYVDVAAGPFAGDPVAAGQWARAEIRARTGLSVSAGLGRSKLIAKLASEEDKPNGFTVVSGADEDRYLLGKPVTALSGVGPATAQVLTKLGIATVAELRDADEGVLRSAAGKAAGSGLYRLARGLDERAVVPSRAVKSVGAERTFAHDVPVPELPAALAAVSDAALTRLRGTGGGARTVTVKVRLGDFTTLTRSVTLPQPAADPTVLRDAARRALDAAGVTERVRLLGVSFAGLAPFAQLTLGADDTPAEGPFPARAAVPGPVALSPAACVPGIDVAHADHGRGWVVGRDGPSITVRFETPDGPAARRDHVLDAREAGLLLHRPFPPSGATPAQAGVVARWDG